MTENSSQERTEPASEEKLRKARRDGQVPKSAELSSALILSASAVVLLHTVPALGAQFVHGFRRAVAIASAPALDAAVLQSFAADSLSAAGRTLLGLLATLAASAVLLPFLQVGPLLALAPLAPKLERLNPAAGLKRLFFEADSWLSFAKSALKLVIVALVCWSTLDQSLPRLLSLGSLGFGAAVTLTGEIVRTLLIRALLCLVALGLLDLVHERLRFAKRMRMSKEDVRQEQKDEEGDPNHRAARRQMHQDIAQHTMIELAREADVLVVNPTHIACALRYRPGESGAPRLVAKGEGALAARLREMARAEGIPIVRDISLARALYGNPMDSEIPEDLYEAAIEVLRWVEQVARAEGWTPAWREARSSDSAESAATNPAQPR
jgi:type III secretion protein U